MKREFQALNATRSCHEIFLFPALFDPLPTFLHMDDTIKSLFFASTSLLEQIFFSSSSSSSFLSGSKPTCNSSSSLWSKKHMLKNWEQMYLTIRNKIRSHHRYRDLVKIEHRGHVRIGSNFMCSVYSLFLANNRKIMEYTHFLLAAHPWLLVYVANRPSFSSGGFRPIGDSSPSV